MSLQTRGSSSTRSKVSTPFIVSDVQLFSPENQWEVAQADVTIEIPGVRGTELGYNKIKVYVTKAGDYGIQFFTPVEAQKDADGNKVVNPETGKFIYEKVQINNVNPGVYGIVKDAIVDAYLRAGDDTGEADPDFVSDEEYSDPFDTAA